MEEFIQKYLSCRNLENYEDLIDGFPIIYVKLNNQMKRLLIYRFVNNKMPNYIVIGKYDENFIFDKDQFSEWLKSLNFLIHYNLKEGFTEEYLRQLEIFKNSFYFSRLKFTQEGFDIINNKQLFIPTGNIQRTVIVNIKLENGDLIFDNSCYFDPTNKVLSGDFFHNYSEYEKKYFLNKKELETMGYYDVLDFAKANLNRLISSTGIENLKNISKDLNIKQNQMFLLQSLDFAIAQCNEEIIEEKVIK